MFNVYYDLDKKVAPKKHASKTTAIGNNNHCTRVLTVKMQVNYTELCLTNIGVNHVFHF